MLRGQHLDIDCPTCDRSVRVTFGQVASNATVRCPAGHAIDLRDEGGRMEQAVRAGDELDRALKRLGGK